MSLPTPVLQSINAYWARPLVIGQVKPPKTVLDCKTVRQSVQNYLHAIGYIDSELLDDSVKEVFRVQ